MSDVFRPERVTVARRQWSGSPDFLILVTLCEDEVLDRVLEDLAGPTGLPAFIEAEEFDAERWDGLS